MKWVLRLLGVLAIVIALAIIVWIGYYNMKISFGMEIERQVSSLMLAAGCLYVGFRWIRGKTLSDE